MPGSFSSGSSWQVEHRVSEGTITFFFFYMEHTVAPIVRWSLKRPRSRWHTEKPQGTMFCGEHHSSQEAVITGTANAEQSQRGTSCTQCCQLLPEHMRHTLRLPEGGRVWLERPRSFVRRDLQGQKNSGINITIVWFVCAVWWGWTFRGHLGTHPC